jgi:hypothetical protein
MKYTGHFDDFYNFIFEMGIFYAQTVVLYLFNGQSCPEGKFFSRPFRNGLTLRPGDPAEK